MGTRLVCHDRPLPKEKESKGPSYRNNFFTQIAGLEYSNEYGSRKLMKQGLSEKEVGSNTGRDPVTFNANKGRLLFMYFVLFVLRLVR